MLTILSAPPPTLDSTLLAVLLPPPLTPDSVPLAVCGGEFDRYFRGPHVLTVRVPPAH
ncbi:MAG: hypothetical protein ACREQH_12005 [Candidatus Binatus sp.]